MDDAEMLDAISDATRELKELLAHGDAILERVRPALARANGISDGIQKSEDVCPFWDATGLTTFSLLVEELCDSLQRHDRLDWLAGS
jgi:hypothetical protein